MEDGRALAKASLLRLGFLRALLALELERPDAQMAGVKDIFFSLQCGRSIHPSLV